MFYSLLGAGVIYHKFERYINPVVNANCVMNPPLTELLLGRHEVVIIDRPQHYCFGDEVIYTTKWEPSLERTFFVLKGLPFLTGLAVLT